MGGLWRATSIWEHFSVLRDPRVDRTKLHKLEDILTIALCAVICGAETWVDITDFGRAKEAWLRTWTCLIGFLPRIPSASRQGDVETSVALFDLVKTELEKIMMLLSMPGWMEVAKQKKIIMADGLHTVVAS